MDKCYKGINIPAPIEAPCGGEYKSTDCISTPSALVALDLAAGASQTLVNEAIENAFIQKEIEIQSIIEDILPFTARKIYRGSFLGSTLIPAEDTINDLSITNLSTGMYELTSDSFSIATSIVVTPNSIESGFEEISITYLYTNVSSGSIVFKVKNNGVLVDLLESPIKIEA